MPATNRITLVLRAKEGDTLEQVMPFIQLGAPVAIGRGMAVIAGASDEDLQMVLGQERDDRQMQAELDDLPPFSIDDHIRMVANARRYEWLRDVAFDTPRQDLVPRDKSGNMLIEQDLDSEIDCAMHAYPGEQEVEPCED